ncbi:MAG: inositol monophosphatase family protein [Bacteroidota bacterium]
MDIARLAHIAGKAAVSAGKVIRTYYKSDLQIHLKVTGTSKASQVVTEADKASERILLEHLQPTCSAYDIALLSEETPDDQSRFEKDYFWCIDPMDGTLAFINNRPGFSLSIALVAKDGTPKIGVVYDPLSGNFYHAIQGGGAYKNGSPWIVNGNNNFLTYVTDRTLKDTPRAEEIHQYLNTKVQELQLKGIQEIAGGGAVYNAIQVLENGPACMLKFPKKTNGGGSLWDYAATACLFQELGLSATNFNGGPLDLNRKESTFMNHEGILFTHF